MQKMQPPLCTLASLDNCMRFQLVVFLMISCNHNDAMHIILYGMIQQSLSICTTMSPLETSTHNHWYSNHSSSVGCTEAGMYRNYIHVYWITYIVRINCIFETRRNYERILVTKNMWFYQCAHKQDFHKGSLWGYHRHRSNRMIYNQQKMKAEKFILWIWHHKSLGMTHIVLKSPTRFWIESKCMQRMVLNLL